MIYRDRVRIAPQDQDEINMAKDKYENISWQKVM